MWGERAAPLKGVSRGTLISVEGRLKTRSYVDKKSGEKRWITEVDVKNFTLLDAAGNAPQQTQTRAQPAPVDEDKIPF